jgi:murein DD-endopeptidase
MHLLLAAVTTLLFAIQSAPRPPIVQSVDIAVPFAPVTFTQDGRTQLVDELHLTNFQRTDVTLTGVHVEATGAVLGDYRDAELNRRIVRPGLRNDHATPQIIGPGMRAVVNLWIALPERFAAASASNTSVTNGIELEVGGARATIEASLSIRRPQSPLVLDAPLGGGQWVAIYDPMLKGGHRAAIYTLDGRARIPGRFAIDFIALPRDGMMVRSSATKPPDWNGFGSDVLAVADGAIAAALDDTPDDLAQPVSGERASGNYVAIDLGEGRFAFYEHLQRGSIAVKPGQRVTRGQVIARLGSSGSTSIGPHLHFHVADANSPLGAEGLPFVFGQFTTMGGFESIEALVNGDTWQRAPAARRSVRMRPSPNAVITFR